MHGWPARLLAVALHETLQIEILEFLRVENHLLGDDLAAETVDHTHADYQPSWSFSNRSALLESSSSVKNPKRTPFEIKEREKEKKPQHQRRTQQTQIQ